MLQAAGVVHKRRQRIALRRMPGIAGLSGNSQIGKTKNLDHFSGLLPGADIRPAFVDQAVNQHRSERHQHQQGKTKIASRPHPSLLHICFHHVPLSHISHSL